MFYIYISPAKKMSKNNDCVFDATTPIYYENVKKLVEILKTFSPLDIKRTMKVSDKLSVDTYEYYQNFGREITPALFKYDGLVYKNIAPNTLDEDQLNYLKEHLLIGSGLFGLVRAFDGICNYRLELNKHIKELGDVEEFYTDKIGEFFNEDDIIINLASEEYTRLIAKVKCRVININFIKKNDEKCSMLQTHGKIYRGQMVRYMAVNNIINIDEIKNFFDKNLRFVGYDENNITFMEKE